MWGGTGMRRFILIWSAALNLSWAAGTLSLGHERLTPDLAEVLLIVSGGVLLFAAYSWPRS